MSTTLLILAIPLFILVLFLLDGWIIVQHKTAVVIERLGKFHSVRQAGLQFKIPLIDRVKARQTLQIQELDVDIETKTKDNVFVKTKISVQMRVKPDSVKQATYELVDAYKQTQSYIFDVVRSEVPKMRLDDVFENKDAIAKAIKDSLQEKMNEYGYDVETSLVTDIDPAGNVKAAMNKIQETERLKISAENEAEADKITVVKKAQAEAEAKKLTGQGYADLRTEISKGAEQSIENLKKTGLSAQEAQALILSTQYFETLQHMGQNGNSVLMLPSGSDGTHKMLADFVASGQLSTETKTPESK